MDHAKIAAKALAESVDSITAVNEYTKALVEHPNSPDYFTQRAIAFSRLRPPRHDLALQDAEYGVLCGQKRGKRDKIQAAQQRRVVALYNLKRYADAKLVLDSMKKWRPSNSKPQTMEHDMWSSKIDKKLQGNDQQATTAEYPSVPLPDEKALKKMLQQQLKTDGTYNFDGEEQDMDANNAPASTTTDAPITATGGSSSNSATSSTTLQNIRHEWYQNNENVIITLYAKGVQKDRIDVDIEEDQISISFPHPSNVSSSFSFTLDPLQALIDPSNSRYRVASTKVEVILAKVEQGKKWASIEGTAPLKRSNRAPTEADPVKGAVMTVQAPSTTPTTGPSYPTSSRNGPKNWDKLANDLTAKKPKNSITKAKDEASTTKTGSESEEEGNDDGYESDMGGDAVDGFFKKLYKGADPDTQRAMMKSYTESNGTALSTNWSDVGSKKVEEVKSKDEE